jgi:hypothetical protein
MRFRFTYLFDRPQNRQDTLCSEIQGLRGSTISPPTGQTYTGWAITHVEVRGKIGISYRNRNRLVKRELLLLRNPNSKLDSVSSPKHHCRHKAWCVTSPAWVHARRVRPADTEGRRSLRFRHQSRMRPKFFQLRFCKPHLHCKLS